jgi:hypothetical protein
MFALWSAPVFAASVWGLVRRWRDVRLWVLAAGPIVFLGGVHAVFIGSVRYRLPAEYPLLTLAALGLLDLKIVQGVFGHGCEDSSVPEVQTGSLPPSPPQSPGRG